MNIEEVQKLVEDDGIIFLSYGGFFIANINCWND